MLPPNFKKTIRNSGNFQSSLAALPEFVRDQLTPKLATEAQLIFVLRLVVPILQRFYEAKERSKQIQDVVFDL